MSKKGFMRRKGATRPPLKANACGRSSASTTANSRADREAAIPAGGQAGDPRQEIVDRREQIADRREETADQREGAATLRETALRVQEGAARVKAELSAHHEAQLREANENLVVATVRAQMMAEAAEEATARMAHMAQHDFLTGLPNRSLLTDRLAQAMALARRHDQKVALMYLDLDHFKHINDSLGHEVGDRLLQSAARRLQAGVRLSDTVCRQGGDEFVVLLAEVQTVRDARLIAEKLLEVMAEPHLIGDHRLHVTPSIGISLYPDHGEDVETVVKNADIAMYHAKRSGRNTYRVFAPEMKVRAVARHSVHQALHHGLEQRQFLLHYQPKVNLETGTLTGVEALVRLRQADHRLVGPKEFMSIAESSGLILPIGRWVLREACRQTAAWLQAGLDAGPIAVNVSMVEFRDKDFLAGVRATLNDTGLDPRHLELELTESGLMQDTGTTIANLRALKDLGVRLAIDDFGTGYSSLSYLRRFPLDTLKIDQAFVRDIGGDTEEAALVSTIIAMGQSLKLGVVAEGIETQPQLAFLQSRHCAEGQGFFFSHPVAAEAFATLLESGAYQQASAAF
jgi:diguanylate cyclase